MNWSAVTWKRKILFMIATRTMREESEAHSVCTCTYQICKDTLSLTERNRQEQVDTSYMGRLISLHKNVTSFQSNKVNAATV